MTQNKSEEESILPPGIERMVARFWEHRMGSFRITVLLKDGRFFKDVHVVRPNIVVQVGKQKRIPFHVDDIVEAFDTSLAFELPREISKRVVAFQTVREGVHRVAIRLNDGRIIDSLVVIGGSELCPADPSGRFEFLPDQIVEIVDRSESAK